MTISSNPDSSINIVVSLYIETSFSCYESISGKNNVSFLFKRTIFFDNNKSTHYNSALINLGIILMIMRWNIYEVGNRQ